MIVLKKNAWFATVKEYVFLAVRVTPSDANKEEAKTKNFYIVEIQDRTPTEDGVRAYQNYYKTMTSAELCEILGAGKRERINVI